MIVPLNPPVAEKEIWEVDELPEAMDSDEGDAESVKPVA